MPDVPIDRPENRGFRARFGPRAAPGRPILERPEDVGPPWLGLGVHPDLLDRLWREVPRSLPVDCRRVFLGCPVLVHPETGVVFGLAEGTHAYALRLPAAEHAEAIAGGAKHVHAYPQGPAFDLAALGPEWVFGRWRTEEERWCVAAYAFAGDADADRG